MKKLTLDMNISNEFPLNLTADENRLKQILINLISNAIKYTKTGFVKVEARPMKEEQKISISVIDSGVGIEKKKLNGLFSAFNKIMRNRELNLDGVGLGLTICKNLAVAMGGGMKTILTI